MWSDFIILIQNQTSSLFWLNTNSASAKKRRFPNGNGLKWSHMTSNDAVLSETWMRCCESPRERNESRSDWIHAEITDRRKRRAGESQTRKAVITVLQVLVALVTARVTWRVSWRDAALGQKLLLGVSGWSLVLRVTVTFRWNNSFSLDWISISE